MKADNAERFEGLLAALERELIEATDEEILAAARELGMPPGNEGLGGVLRQRDRFLSAIPAERPAESADAPTPRADSRTTHRIDGATIRAKRRGP
jgi:hypothetical protein